MYYTLSKEGVVDSISDSYKALKKRFPDEKIYKADKPLKSIYVEQ